MGSNFPARAATSGELEKFRGPNNIARTKLIIDQPVVVFSAQIDQTFETLDGVFEFAYDNPSGDYEDVLANMTVFIGSSAGAYDKGITRVRKAITEDTFYIPLTSDIQFAEDDHITVLEAFSPFQRDPSNYGGVYRMDYDIEFGSYLNGGCLPRVGPIAAVIKLVGGVASFSPPDPSDSACYDGATISSIRYEAPGASSTSDMDTSSPSWEYDTAGKYRWTCIITDSLGRETVTHRWVFVDPDTVDCEVEYCGGMFQNSNWMFTVRATDGVDISEIHDRAMCVLYSEDYYNGVQGSIGRIEGYENIWCVGWIDGESIVFDTNGGGVTFNVHGPAFWFSKLRAYPFELIDTDSDATSWKEINELTVDKALAHILMWLTTATSFMDCYLTDNTVRVNALSEPSGNILQQLDALAVRVFAKTLVNNLGQMFIEVDPQVADSTTRDTFPEVMEITAQDRAEGLTLLRNLIDKVSQIILGGLSAYDGTFASEVYSIAPGTIPKRFGEPTPYQNYLFEDQDECNRIAGCLLAWLNNPYEPLEVNLFGSNNRLIDITPRMWLTITSSAVVNPRGIAFSQVRAIPRGVELRRDRRTGEVSTIVMLEFEVVGVDGVTYVPLSQDLPGFNEFDFGDPGFADFPDANLGSWFPNTIPPGVDTPCASNTPNHFASSWDLSELRGEDSSKLLARCYFPCTLRSTGNDSYLDIACHIEGDAAAHFGVYAVKDGSRVLAATTEVLNYGNLIRATFTPVSDTDVDGFEIELDAGIGSIVIYTPMDIIASGSAAATDGTGTPVSVVAGQYYAVDAVSGAFDPDGAGPLGDVSSCNFNGVAHISVETITGIFQRVTQQASSSSHNVTVSDNIFGDNTGGPVGWVVRNVRADGRRIALSAVTIRNVCNG